MMLRRRLLRMLPIPAVASLALLVLAPGARAELVAYWTFDGDNIADSSGSGFNGTLVGGAFSSDVPAALGGGRSLDLTGGDYYAIIDSAGAEAGLDLPYGITVAAWVKGWPDGSWEPFVSKRGESGQGWQLRRQGGSSNATFTLRGTSGPDDPQGSININNSNWKLVVGTYNGWTRSLYVDGVLDRSDPDGGAIANTDSLVVLGARDNSGGGTPSVGNFSRVQLDDVAIFDRGLAANQVEYLAAGGDPATLPDAPKLELPAGTLLVAGPHGPGGTYNIYAKVGVSSTWDLHRVNAAQTELDGVAGHLVSIGSAEENATVRKLASAEPFIGLTDSTGTSTIDGFNFTTLGTSEAGSNPTVGWAWLDGSPVVYTNWAGGEPNNSGEEDIAVMRTSGQWNDNNAGASVVGGGTQSNSTAPAVIEYDTGLAEAPDLTGFFQGTGQIDPLTGHYYERVDAPLTWDEARVAATQRQVNGAPGHLATISDGVENEFVRIAGGSGDKWIGLTDSDQTSLIDGATMGGTEFGNTSGEATPPDGNRGAGWVWVTGEPVNYYNWNGGEPNDSGGEDAGQIRGDGLWNDNRAGTTLGQTDTRLSSAIEYEPDSPWTLNYLERKADTGVFGTLNLDKAKQLLALPSGDAAILDEATADVYAVSFQDPDNGGGRGEYLRRPFLTDTGTQDDNDFAVLVSGDVVIPEPGEYTFAVSHDDHFELTVGDNTFTSSGCCGNPTLINGANVFTFDEAGTYDLELFWHERAGGAYLQLFSAPGNQSVFDPRVFALVGDTANGGLALGVPEPSTLVLAGLSLLGFGAFLRRRKKSTVS